MTWYQIGAVFRREWHERARRPGYWLTTFLGMALMVALVVVPSLVTQSIHSAQTVGSLGVSPALLKAVKPAGVLLTVRSFTTYHQAASQVLHHQMAGFFRMLAGRVVFYGQPDSTITAMIAGLNQHALAQALPVQTVQVVQRLAAATAVRVVPLSPTRAIIVRSLSVYALNIVMMVLVMAYGAFIGMSVIEEKETRHAEMLMAWIRPRPLMFGKIAGFAALAFLQLALWAMAGLTALAIKQGGHATFGISFGVVLFFLVWAVIGYLEFSTAFAALAARAQRAAELNQAVMPMTFLGLIGYMGSILALAHPGGVAATLLHVGAFVPFLAPFLGFALLQLGGMPVWQVMVDAVWQLVFWWALLGYAAGLFQRHLLNYHTQLKRRPFGRRAR